MSLFDSIPRPSRALGPASAHLPGWLGLAEQRTLVDACRDLARAHGMQRPQLQSGQMSVFMLPLGYRWQGNLNSYVAAEVGVPEWVGELAKRCLWAGGDVAPGLKLWRESYRAEMLLINYYPPGASMGLHQDLGEESEAPIISLSFGDSALFRLGNVENRNKPWRDVQLLSGDVVVFGGPDRRAFHGVPRIYPGTAPEGCGVAEGRINLTIRQVKL